jgi:hypothetical protein
MAARKETIEMSTRNTRSSRSTADEMVEEAAAYLVGGGIITMAAFPFAVPIILLIAVPVIPIALVAGAVGVAVLATGVLLVGFARLVVAFAGRLRHRRPGAPGGGKRSTARRASEPSVAAIAVNSHRG